MSNDIRARLTGVQAAGPVRRGGGSMARAAMNALSGRVAGQIADALKLARDDRDNGRQHGRGLVLPNDLYDVEQEGAALAAELAAGPAEAARLTQALHGFAEACATLVAAQPAAWSIERIRTIVQESFPASERIETAGDVQAAIERATAAIDRRGS